MDALIFQKSLVTKLEQMHGEKFFKTKVADVLHISMDSLYKKLRGESSFSLQEILILVDKYKINILELMDNDKNLVLFDCTEVVEMKGNYRHYLENIMIKMEAASKLPERYVYYISNEISLFQYFQYPILAAFKLYTWGRTNWEINLNQDIETGMQEILADSKILFMLEEISDYYNSFPSSEIWSINILDNTLNQMKWFIDSMELKNPELIMKILDAVHQLLAHNKEVMKKGIKKPNNKTKIPTELKVYYNEMTHTNNTILVQHEMGLITYLTHDNPNFMVTNSPQFGEYTFTWIQKMIRKSDNIAGQSEKLRSKYFSILESKLGTFEKSLML